MKVKTMTAMAVALSACVLAGRSWATSGPACARGCLIDTLNVYLSAVAKHDPSSAPLAVGLRATENTKMSEPGAGLWTSMTGLGEVQRRYADAQTGQAAYFGTIKEGDSVDIAMVRLKVVDRRIVESEWVVARPGDRWINVAGLPINPPPVGPPPLAEGTDRVTMLRAAHSYFQGLNDHQSGEVLAIGGCKRIENGNIVAPGYGKFGAVRPPTSNTVTPTDCHGRFERMQAISSIVQRRFPLVDTTAGVVLGTSVFLRPNDGPFPSDDLIWKQPLLVSEIFEIRHGRIAGIWAAMINLPANQPADAGWSEETATSDSNDR